jgi:hypothetical protein
VPVREARTTTAAEKVVQWLAAGRRDDVRRARTQREETVAVEQPGLRWQPSRVGERMGDGVAVQAEGGEAAVVVGGDVVYRPLSR